MTFEERVHALKHLRLTDRQTRFVVTVALHSGYCVRRQYLAFAGVRYGKNVRDFLDGLVLRGLALRFTYRMDRGHVYHLHARSLYRAIEQEDNRNRRVASPALIARKLMLLDCAIGTPDVEWFVTEMDKVELFTNRLAVPAADLPHHVVAVASDTPGNATRYFVHKLPIYLAGEPAVPHFVYLASDTSARAFEHFLRDHALLFSRLSAWAVVCVRPSHVTDVSEFERAFHRFVSGAASVPDARLSTLFRVRRLVEDGQLGQLSAVELHQYRTWSRLYEARQFDREYSAWVTAGEAPVAEVSTVNLAEGRLHIQTLPHAYEQFGSMAGVA